MLEVNEAPSHETLTSFEDATFEDLDPVQWEIVGTLKSDRTFRKFNAKISTSPTTVQEAILRRHNPDRFMLEV